MIGSRLHGRFFVGAAIALGAGVGATAWLGPWLGGAVALLICAASSYALARPLARRLAELRSLAGPLDADAAGDDIGGLSRAILGMVGRLEDQITDIARDRDKLLTILSGMSEGVIAVDREERVLHMNEAAGKILDVVPDVCAGKPIWEVTRVHEIPAAIKGTIDTGAKHSAEITLVRRPRDQVIVLHAAPLRDQDATTGAVVVLEVLTELRQLEEIRRDFVANVSHELKTPITAIRGFAETLVDDHQMVPATRERFHQKILNQALRLSTLVSDLLTLARLESSEGVLDAEPVDLARIVTASVAALLAAAEARQIRVETSFPATRVVVNGDPSALNQLVTNLLDNAIKYTPERGRVWVRVSSDAKHAYVAVQDTGVGIDPKHQKRIFERFYRIDKARSRELGGTGLGLSIVKHICLAHGGEVALDSITGRGTTFTVKLPRLEATESESLALDPALVESTDRKL
ncbi:MAG: sensor histidine kinase [Planctomycetota bacterium]